MSIIRDRDDVPLLEYVPVRERINGMDAFDFWFTLVVWAVCIPPVLVAALLLAK